MRDSLQVMVCALLSLPIRRFNDVIVSMLARNFEVASRNIVKPHSNDPSSCVLVLQN
jgi:hypothetical protein